MKTAANKARRAQGDRSRQAILEVAVHLASVEGLDGLTIGRLASETGMSKSGLFAHFGSKEDLQLATVDAARSIIIERVIRPAFEAKKGLPRLRRLCEIWFDYAENHVFRGGCFFAAAAAEFDSRPGRVRDRIAEIMKEWLEVLRWAIVDAQEAGQFDLKMDAIQLAFEINALEIGANWALQLFGDKQAFTRARTAVLERLRSHARGGRISAPASAAVKRRGKARSAQTTGGRS
jgi:AcrR family transcriptional regulator